MKETEKEERQLAAELEKEYEAAGVPADVVRFCLPVLDGLRPEFERIDRIEEAAQLKVLTAMQAERVSAECFGTSTGYGYDDPGRETLERVYARIFGTEAAIVRAQIVCGTHALALALGGVLRPGDVMFSPCGKPYDTLDEVIGLRPCPGSLAEFGIGYRQTELTADGGFDWEQIGQVLADPAVRLVHIQRSRGYASRPTLSVAQIGELIAFVKDCRPDAVCLVDNCYGEFTELTEPTQVGADLAVGSLIKPPGGGLAPIGGYIAGRADLIDRIGYRLTSPGLGLEVGATLGVNRSFFQGLFLAPSVTAAAMKGAVFTAAVYEKLGFPISPGVHGRRSDIIQSVDLLAPEVLESFCRGIQAAAPVDSYVAPIPWDMPGYDSQVIMAAGAFISGSSIELSADGPMRPPYTVFFQGGLTWPHAKIGVMKSVASLLADGLITLG